MGPDKRTHFTSEQFHKQPPAPTASPLLLRFHLLIAKAFWHGDVFVKKRGLNLGHLSKEDTGTRTLLQLISKCLAPAFGQRIDLHKTTSRDESASLSSPCSPLVQPALDMLPGFRLTVSVTTIKLRMKASEGGQGRGTQGTEGVGTACQPGGG